MLSRTGSLQLRRCGGSEIGIGSREGKAWPAGELLLASIRGPRSTHSGCRSSSSSCGSPGICPT